MMQTTIPETKMSSLKQYILQVGCAVVHSKLQNAASCSCLQVKLILTVSTWTSHSCEDGQYHHGGLHQSSGGLRSRHLHTLARRLTFPPSESNTRSKLLESGSRPMVWHRPGSFWDGCQFRTSVTFLWLLEINLSDNTGVSISHSETLKGMLGKRTLGYLRNHGFQSSLTEMSHQTAILVGLKRKEVLIFNNDYVIVQAI